MATKIGIRDVLKLQPHTFLWDSKVRGFHARRQFGDAVTFAVFYRNNEGLQRWHKIGRFGVWTVSQAREQAQRILRARDLGEDPSAERNALRNAMTMAELCDEYVADMQSGKVTGKMIAGLLGHARQGITSRYMHLGDKALLDASDLVANETLRLLRTKD
jgi:hypothetical protein